MKTPGFAIPRPVLLLIAALFGCQAAAVTTGKICPQDGEFAKARQALEVAALATPDDGEVHFLLGKAYAGDGDYTRAVASFARSVELEATYTSQIDEELHRYFVLEHNRGVALLNRDGDAQYGAAAFAFQNATTIDPTAPGGWRNLGYVYFELDELDSAAHAYRMAVRADAGDEGAWLNLGTIEMAAGNNTKALTALTRLLELDANHTAGLQSLATLYERMSLPARAIETYGRLVTVTADNALAHYNLGNLHWQAGSHNAAIAAYERALAIEPDDEDALFNLAVTHVAKGDLDRALPRLQSLSQRIPESSQVWRELGRVYAAKGMVDASREAFAREAALNPLPEAPASREASAP